MKRHYAAQALLATLCLSVPGLALAQSMPGGSSPSGQIANPQPLQPKNPAPDFAPAAIPGAGTSVPPRLSASTNAGGLPKAAVGDPNAQLFTAINKGDYGSVQDALSRGADLNAQNSLGETPIDMSVALNRNSITFLLLSVRNEMGSGPPPGATSGTPGKPASAHAPHVTVVKEVLPPAYRVKAPAQMGNNPGTPNEAAGFLGFSPTK